MLIKGRKETRKKEERILKKIKIFGVARIMIN
jgi:hypothetical protein